MGWLQEHLETFVKPVLGEIPTIGKDYAHYFSPQEMGVIKNMWRSVKRDAQKCDAPILLAGRDVFIFEILARREGYPTVFRPDISRLTVSHLAEDYSDHYLFDTGFDGSIPRALKSKNYTMGSSNSAALFSGGSIFSRRKRHIPIEGKQDPKQVFPRLTGARSLILKIERTPKYWKRGFYRRACNCSGGPAVNHEGTTECWICKGRVGYDGPEGILQEHADRAEFTAAALLTQEIYKDSSPAFSEKVDLRGTYGLVSWSE